MIDGHRNDTGPNSRRNGEIQIRINRIHFAVCFKESESLGQRANFGQQESKNNQCTNDKDNPLQDISPNHGIHAAHQRVNKHNCRH